MGNSKAQIIKYIVLILQTIISLIYCFRLGFIWSAYLHGGQIQGIPFALIMILFLMFYFFTKNKLRKEKWFYGGLIYFLSIGFFSMTIELIRYLKSDYFSFLYSDPRNWANKILLGWIIIGLISFIFTYKKLNKIEVKNL
jgi:hypothetical protein